MSLNTIIASRDFLHVEVRAGNLLNPESNPLVRSGGRMNEGEQFQYESVLLFYRREGNPMVENSGWTFWNSVSLGQTAEIR